VASQVSVELINKTFQKWVEEEASADEIFGEPDSSLSLQGNYILGSIRLANRVVYEMALEQKQHHGMGTTVVIVLVAPGMIIAANVGDSRIYMVRNGYIEQLSKDHSLVAEQVEMGMMTEEEAETSPMRHILTRNLGSAETVEPDIFEIIPSNNDRFILCSDGLTDLVKDDEILEMTQNEDNPEDLCRQFIDKVLKRGAHDNTTVISVFLSDIKKPKEGLLKKTGLLFADMLIGTQKIIKKIIPWA
jgi:protein phosphatase